MLKQTRVHKRRSENSIYKVGIRRGYTIAHITRTGQSIENLHKVYKRLIHRNLILSVDNGFEKIRPHPHSLAIVTDTSDGCFFIRREPFLRSFQFDDTTYTMGHKPSELTAYLNPTRFSAERDSVDLNFSLPSTLQHPDTSFKPSLSYSNTLTSLDTTFTSEHIVSMESLDQTHSVQDEEAMNANSSIAHPCAIYQSMKSSKVTPTSFTPVTMASASSVLKKQTNVLTSSLRVYCILPPHSHSYSKNLPRCTRSSTCPTRTPHLYSLDSLNNRSRKQQEQSIQQSFDEVSLLLNDQSDNSSSANYDAHVDSFLDVTRKETIEIEAEDLNMGHICDNKLRYSQLSAPVPQMHGTPSTIREFGILEHYRRRAIKGIAKQYTNHRSNSSPRATIIHNSQLISPLSVSPLAFSKPKAATSPGIVYEHVPHNSLSGHNSVALLSDSIRHRFNMSHPSFIDNLPVSPNMNQLNINSKQRSSLRVEEYDLKQFNSPQISVKSSLDKSMGVTNLFSSLSDVAYSRSNLSQQERVARIFGPQTINKERTRTIEDIMMTETTDHLSNLQPPLPPDAPPSLTSLYRKRLAFSLSNVGQQRSQMAAYTHFKVRSSSSPLQPQDLSMRNICSASKHTNSRHMQRFPCDHSLDLESPYYSLYQPSRPIDKVLSPFSIPRQANSAISVLEENTLKNCGVNLGTSLPSQINISVDRLSRFTQCVDFNQLSKEATSLMEIGESFDEFSSTSQIHNKNKIPMFSDRVQTPSAEIDEQSHSNSTTCNTKIGLRLDSNSSTDINPGAYSRDTVAFIRQPIGKVTETTTPPRSLISVRNSTKQPPRMAHKRAHPLLPSEVSSDERPDLIFEENAMVITDTSDIAQIFPSSDNLSDNLTGYGVSGEFHGPGKGNSSLIPCTPYNETVMLDLVKTGNWSANKSNQLANENANDNENDMRIRNSLTRQLSPSKTSMISTPTHSAEHSRVHSANRSTFSILPPVAALQGIRNSNYAPYRATDLNGHIYFRSSTPTKQENIPSSQYIVHPERYRLRSTIASKKTSDPDHTSAWSSRASDTSVSHADYKSCIKGTGTVPHLPRHLRYNEFYTERMAQYGHIPIDTSDMDYAGINDQQRLDSETDGYSSLTDLSWHTQYYLMNPQSCKKTVAEIYRIASKRPNNMLKKFLEEKRIMTRRRDRFKFKIIHIVAKVQTQTTSNGEISKRVIFDVY